MKIPGSIYIFEKGKYLALYNYWSDVFRMLPDSMKGKSDHIAHVSYSFRSRLISSRDESRGIDIFYLRDNSLGEEFDIKRRLNSNLIKESNIQIDKRNNLQIQLNPEHKRILDFVRRDIQDFVQNSSIDGGNNFIDYTNEIIPKTKIRKIKANKFLKEGKQEFVPSCVLEANLDFSLGCSTGFSKGIVDGDYIIGAFLDESSECDYCYSKHQHKTFWKTMLDLNPEQLKEELLGNNELNNGVPVKVLRLGKRTEAASQYTLDYLITTFETCCETGTKIILPTKCLPFDLNIANLFRKTNSNLLYSLGFDELETGACNNGCNNDFRMEQAKKYREKGVNSMLYLLIDLPHSSKKREKEVIKFAKKYNIPIQLLPIRITRRELAQKLTGLPWDSLKMNKQGIFSGTSEEEICGYYWKGNALVAQEKDPSWLELINNNDGNIRMCHHDESNTYCGKCFIEPGLIQSTEKIEINYERKRKIREEQRKKKARLIEKRKGPGLFEGINGN